MEYNKLEAVETKDFQEDISSIDAFLKGKINQETWQQEPIEVESKLYIRYKAKFLKDWLGKRKVVEIEIAIEEEL